MSIRISPLSPEPSGTSRFRRAGLRMGVLLISLFLAAAAQAQFTYISSGDGYIVYGYTGSGGAVTIPDTYNGLPVVGIGNSAFSWNSLTSITIPSSVTSIGNSAFSYCVGLASVIIPSSVTSIGDGAFHYCSSLTNITIPSSVTSIGNYAFQYCSSLTSITIPNGVTSIGDFAFSWSSLTSITLPNGVTSIGNYAFGYCYSLTSITIPNSVTSIGYDAFYSCSSLTNITIPNNVTSIGNAAFAACNSLTSVYFRGNAPTPSNNTSVFDGTPATIYYLAGTTGWGATFCGRPTALYTIAPPPTIALMIHGTNLTLNWTAVLGKNYIVEYRADLTSGDWITVTNLTATQTDMSLTLPLTGAQGYYRLGVEP